MMLSFVIWYVSCLVSRVLSPLSPFAVEVQTNSRPSCCPCVVVLYWRISLSVARCSWPSLDFSFRRGAPQNEPF